MDLLAKKKRAAAIAVSCYIQQMDEEVQPTNEKAWRNAGIQRIMLGKEVLFRRGRLVGQKNL